MPRRQRGPIEAWNPYAKTRVLIADVQEILEENRNYWPLSVRSVYYRLLGTGRYAKGASLAGRVIDHVSDARRAGEIPWEAIWDSSVERIEVESWSDDHHWLTDARSWAENFRLDRQRGQKQRLLVWCEAKGMTAMLSSVADAYGIDVLSGSGYDSTTIRHEIGVSTWKLSVPLVVLHVGDLDDHGMRIYRAVAEDVIAWAEAGEGEAEFVRLAVTPEQVEELQLPDNPDPKHRGDVQAEAIPPAEMSSILRRAITSRLDEEQFRVVLGIEETFRSRLLTTLDPSR